MKKLFSVILLFISCSCFGQMRIGYHYKMKDLYDFGGDLNLQYSIGGRVQTKHIAPRRDYLGITLSNMRADLIPKDSGRIKVVFWSISRAQDMRVGYDHSNTYVNNRDSVDNFYLVVTNRSTLGDATFYRSFPYATTEIGAISIPFKYYFGNSNKEIPNNVSKSINGGMYIGRKWGRQRFYYDSSKNHESASFVASAFGGPTEIDLKESNVKNKDTSVFKGESSELGVSLGVGFLYSYRNFNVGFYIGEDVPLNKNTRNWKYANRLWLGFGIGYGLNILNAGR